MPDIAETLDALVPRDRRSKTAKTVTIAHQVPTRVLTEAAHQIRWLRGLLAKDTEEIERLQKRSDWLLHNAGLLNDWAKDWHPSKTKLTLVEFLEARVNEALGDETGGAR